MSKQAGSRITRSPMIWIALIAVGLGGVLRLTYLSAEDGEAFWPILIGLLIVLAAVVVIYAALNASARGLVLRVAENRPTATVVLTMPAALMVDTAARIGANGAGIRADGSKYTAIAILPDRIELWAGRTPEPRWSVRRTHESVVALVHTKTGSTSMDALCLAADEHDEAMIVVRPVPRPIWLDFSRKRRQAAMEQLIRDLGRDPAQVLGTVA